MVTELELGVARPISRPTILLPCLGAIHPALSPLVTLVYSTRRSPSLAPRLPPQVVILLSDDPTVLEGHEPPLDASQLDTRFAHWVRNMGVLSAPSFLADVKVGFGS